MTEATVVPITDHEDTASSTQDSHAATGPEDSGNTDRTAEIDTVLHLPPTELHVAETVREDVEPGEEIVADVRTRGVTDALRGYRATDGAVVITTGHLRLAAAIDAKAETVPVWMQAPPPGDDRKAAIARIVDQHNTNVLQRPLSAAERRAAVTQLTLLDLTPTGIARKLSRPKAEIEATLTVAGSTQASHAVDEYDITLDHAAMLAEFDTDEDQATFDRLLRVAQNNPQNLASTVEREHAERAEQKQFAALRSHLEAELATAGIPILANHINRWGAARPLDYLRLTPETEPGVSITLEEHLNCPGHSAWIDESHDETDQPIVTAVYGCQDWSEHDHETLHASRPVTPADDDTDIGNDDGNTTTDQTDTEADDDDRAVYAAEMKAQRQAELQRARRAEVRRGWVQECQDQWRAARTVRQRWLAGIPSRKKVPSGTEVWLAHQAVLGTLAPAVSDRHILAHTMLDLPVPLRLEQSQLLKRLTTSPTKGTLLHLYLTLCACEKALSTDAWRVPTVPDQNYMKALIGWGYTPSDIERAVLDPADETAVIDALLAVEDTDAPEHTDENDTEETSGETVTDVPSSEGSADLEVITEAAVA